MTNKVVTIENKKDEKFLRRKTEDFDFKKFSKKEVGELVLQMKRAMREANGLGLSANQIGINLRVFVAEISTPDKKTKLYAVFNPKIEKSAPEKSVFEEGCLSVPGTFGEVERSERITLVGQDKYSKPLKIKAWGLLAQPREMRGPI